MSSIVDYVRQHLPRCFDKVSVSPIDVMFEDRGEDYVTFRIASADFDRCHVVGHDLNCDDPSYSGETEFVGPITLEWPNGNSTLLFDSEIHGYHGELKSSAKIHRVGEASSYHCNQCGNATLLVDVQLNYYDDLLDDFEPTEVSNYFHNIIIQGKCSRCSYSNCIVDMDL